MIRQECRGENEDKGAGIERDGVVLTDVSGPTHGADKCWDKVLDGLGTGAKHVLRVR